MIPNHVQEEYKKLSQAQQIRFQELVSWAGGGEIAGGTLPIDYDAILAMVKRMGDEPVDPVAPTIPDDPEFTFKDYFKNPPKG